ncbi:hypothetical protein HYPSUDRAFT_199273 [Hypholoma sublateritium FD-334 SS-4]|uniref:Uncharacterized protein n=1 Tax=Hypholoma sublateritium (strain FD-334 SS-4) TaxID=945553 RepID=A0A0D2LET0_HYPSF|nr:hypothetical protein HYPSUDRAFT_199273 [Hypholoma sublateritium FD-334 SS-4]
MKNSVRRGLLHSDDIKTIGLAAATGPAPLSAALPGLVRKPSRQSINTFDTQHARGGSLASAPGGAGSFGRNEAKKAQNQAEFAMEQPLQTLQLNTRPSDKSWALAGTAITPLCLKPSAGYWCQPTADHRQQFEAEIAQVMQSDMKKGARL